MNYNNNNLQTTQLKLKIISKERNENLKRHDNLQRAIEGYKARLINLKNEMTAEEIKQMKDNLEEKEIILFVVKQIIDLLTTLYNHENDLIKKFD